MGVGKLTGFSGPTGTYEYLWVLVFEGPVQSILWALQACNWDQDQSHILTIAEKTRPNHTKPVQVSCTRLQNQSKLVLNRFMVHL